MRPRAPVSASAGRPSGTDGTDFPFRMTVDNRYKKTVEKKFQLQKLLIAQSAFQLLKTFTTILMAINGEHIARTTVASCAFGGAAVLAGTIGLRRSSSKYLKIFMFITSATVLLSIVPFISGHYYNKVSRGWEKVGIDGNYKPLVIDGLEAAQELIGVIVQLSEILVTLSLLQYLSRKRSS